MESEPLYIGAFAGREQFAQILRDALTHATQAGWREMIWCDPSFTDWPLAERSVEASLQEWSAADRKLTLIAKNYNQVTSHQHRFVNWRKQWSHIIEARAVAGISDDDFPSLLWSPEWALQRSQLTWSKGVCTSDPAQRLAVRELLQDLYSKSSAAFAAVTLGL